MSGLLKRIRLTSIITALSFNLIAKTLPAMVLSKVSQASESAWSLKRQITITNNGEKTINAVVKIQLNTANFDYSKTLINGADIRFSKEKTFNGSGMAYWIEKWNENGYTTIWVKIPVLKGRQKTTLYMFYGNASAEASSNGDETFLFFDDFESGDYSKKWTNVSIGEIIEREGMLKLKETDGEDGIIAANFEITGKMIIRTLYKRDGADEHWTRAGIGGWNYFLCFGDHTDFAGTGTNYLMIYDSNSIYNLKDEPIVKLENGKIEDKWRSVSLWYDGKNFNGIQDHVKVSWPIAKMSSKLFLRTLDNDAWDSFAFITVSPFTNSEQKVTLGLEEN